MRWPEVPIDLVGADRGPVASLIHFVGSIKWLDARTFDRHDHDNLVQGFAAIPGVTTDTPKVAVSRAGFEPGLPPAAAWTPEDLPAAWQR